jgi:hypothetical protein
MDTFTVTSNLDVTDANDGLLTLREALAAAADGDRIEFDASLAGSTITLAQGQLLIDKDITIDGDTDGDGKADITLSGDRNGDGVANTGDTRVILTEDGTDVTLSSLTITNGFSNSGAGVLARGDLTLVNSTISNSESTGSGGGLTAFAQLLVVNSAIIGNTANNFGGGVLISGSIAVATLVNTTVSSNSTGQGGGGISVEVGASLTLQNSTITANTAVLPGGGVENFSSTVTVNNSVIAGNTASSLQNVDYVSASLSDENSFENSFFGSEVNANFTDNGGNIFNGGDPMLGALQDNGGPVETHAPLPGSPLINAGANALLPTDTTDIDGDADTSEPLPLDATGAVRVRETVDIGAVERQVGSLVNGDFAQGLDGWTVNKNTGGQPPIHLPAEQAVAFNSANETDIGDGIEQTFATQPGIVHSVETNFVENNSGNSDHTFQIQILDDSGTEIASETRTVENKSTERGLFTFTATTTQTKIVITNMATTDSRSSYGKLLSVEVRELSGDDNLVGTDDGETIGGGAGDDSIDGDDGDDTLAGGTGDDTLSGGDGEDTAVFAGNRDQFTISAIDGTVSGNGQGTDKLDGIEFLLFDDTTLAVSEIEIVVTTNLDVVDADDGLTSLR